MTTNEWNFDGRGINGGGEYRDRIATLTEHGHALKAGPVMAAAPELAEALREALRMLDIAWKYDGDVFGKHHNDCVDACQQGSAALKKAGVEL